MAVRSTWWSQIILMSIVIPWFYRYLRFSIGFCIGFSLWFPYGPMALWDHRPHGHGGHGGPVAPWAPRHNGAHLGNIVQQEGHQEEDMPPETPTG